MTTNTNHINSSKFIDYYQQFVDNSFYYLFNQYYTIINKSIQTIFDF